ncbi:MAG: HAD family hydrolase [Synechocystis sp.]|jgi:phosphoglycolate phosphatase-like HAD superfamily hydrolase
MSVPLPTLLALDFDGVICDGLLEYFQSTKLAYQQIWTDGSGLDLDSQADAFYQLRPVIESGWEMPLLLRALMLGLDQTNIQQNWTAIAKALQAQEGVNKAQLGPAIDHVRDRWIQQNLDQWLALHRFYPGVLDQLNNWLTTKNPPFLYIVTTKEGRFVQRLLHSHGVNFPTDQIIGKEIQQPKFKTLQQLLQKHHCPGDRLWFVEDLLKTLTSVAQHPGLEQVQLFLADWGYNTAAIRSTLQSQNRFHLLALPQFTGKLDHWIES